MARPGLKLRSPSRDFKLCGSMGSDAKGTAILVANVTPASVALNKTEGRVRVYSNPLVEKNRKTVKGNIESRGVNRFSRLAVSPEPEQVIVRSRLWRKP